MPPINLSPVKIFLVLFSLAFTQLTLNAQSYIGFMSDNYSGVNRVIVNPASIADTPFKFDINLAGASSFFGNDAYSAESISDLFDDDFEFPDSLTESLTNNNFAYSYTDVLGPSLMINLNEKSAIALYTRARAIGNLTEVDGPQIEQFTDDFDIETDDFIINNLSSTATAHAWGEIGLSYARILKNDNQHFFKAGATVKYLVGLASGYGETNNLTVNYLANGEDLLDNLADGNITAAGGVNYGLSYGDIEDDFEYDNLEMPSSIAFDFGGVYEWRPSYGEYYVTDKKGNKVLDRTKNKYKLRVGLSVTDIGKITYSEGTFSNLTINSTTLDFLGELSNANDINEVQDILDDETYSDLIDNAVAGSSFEDLVNQLQNAGSVAEVENIIDNNSNELADLIDDLDDVENLDDLLNDYNLVNTTAEGNEIEATLPTVVHLDADWSFNKNLFLNLATNISLTSRSKIGRNSIANEVRLTPRLEGRTFSLFSPVRLVQGHGVLWGLGFRLGPLYAGSGSIMSNVLGSFDGADVYAGLKIPGLKSRRKDTDGDGIWDRKDDCPEVAGPKENKGCPWPDTDGDSVIDKEDECVEISGPAANNGCPWPDTDNDGVFDKDDECIDEAGPKENKGCPIADSDNDGVADKDDECPNLAGEVAHNGCPDSDGDGVADKNDQCPQVAGTITNNGCPEVTETVQKELNSFAKTILFDSAKTSIKAESNTVMMEIVRILNEYPNATFVVEGHTDSIGSFASNQSLSEQRAQAVMDFLVAQGIDANRLSAIGYGETKPIATNMYKEGRKQNRRVEINLVK